MLDSVLSIGHRMELAVSNGSCEVEEDIRRALLSVVDFTEEVIVPQWTGCAFGGLS